MISGLMKQYEKVHTHPRKRFNRCRTKMQKENTYKYPHTVRDYLFIYLFFVITTFQPQQGLHQVFWLWSTLMISGLNTSVMLQSFKLSAIHFSKLETGNHFNRPIYKTTSSTSNWIVWIGEKRLTLAQSCILHKLTTFVSSEWMNE